MKLSLTIFACLIATVAAAQTPDTDMNRRACAVALNKAEADLGSVIKNAHQSQALLELTVEDLRVENAKLKKELEEAKNAKHE